MSVAGKTQREKRARHERERVVEADDHSRSRLPDWMEIPRERALRPGAFRMLQATRMLQAMRA
jgi:hypothetical protein